MHIKVAAIGQRMPTWVDEGWREYARRLPRTLSLELLEIPAEKRGKSGHPEEWMARECARLMAGVPDNAHSVALDIDGERWSTEQLADQLSRWMSAGKDVVFMIGGPDGLTPECRAAAAQRWSLGALTLPHPLVRVVLIEQLYRAWTILNNHPYHRS